MERRKKREAKGPNKKKVKLQITCLSGTIEDGGQTSNVLHLYYNE